MPSDHSPTRPEIAGETVDLTVGLTILLLPLTITALPGVILLLVLPAVLLLAVVAVPALVVGAVLAPPLLLIGHRPQAGPVILESVGRPVVLVHRHILRSRSVKELTNAIEAM
jgi:hypothetical protein